MNANQALDYTSKLIAFKSLSGSESAIASFLESDFVARGWKVTRIPVEDNRDNIFVTFGQPEILFTSHMDIVPAPDELFTPKFKDGVLFGRGACDAKGMVAAMVATVEQLLAMNETNFGLLIVVGEEVDGIGAQKAATALKDCGIRYIVNGEPTENKIVPAHKGGVGVKIRTIGRSCHSGYPELGNDANAKLIQIATRLLSADFGSDSVLGNATVNIGLFAGGTAGNIVSDYAEMTCLIRTVGDNNAVIKKLYSLCDDAQVELQYDCPVAKMITVPGFDTAIAKYCTDVPNFSALNAQAVLFGPGSIHHAHTVHEHITQGDMELGIQGYLNIFKFLKSTLCNSMRAKEMKT